MVKTQHDYNKEKMQQKALIDKIDNKKVAKKIDIYANSVIDTVVVNKDVKGYTPENVLTNLININKPKIDKEYEKVIKNKKTSDTLLHQVTVQKTANNKAVQISEEQYARLQKNIEVIQGVLNKYEVSLDKYKELNEKYPKTTSRKGIVTESIMNKNYLTGTLGINIVPHFEGYKELSPLTEALHRQAQNEASKDLAEAQNEEAERNGEELPNTHKTWIWTGAGETTRHMSNDGQTVPIDEPFIIVNDVDGQVDEMMYPLDPNVYSSNGFICYCEVEYHNRGDESKFELSSDMIMALDSAIEALNEKMPNDAYDTNINAGEPVDTSGLEVDALLSDNIPSEHSGLATELIDQYSKLTNLDKLPMNATYKVLQEHYKLQSVEELGQLKKNLDMNKKPTVNDVVELVQKQIDTWEIIKPLEKTPQLETIEKELEYDVKYLKEQSDNLGILNQNIEDINEAFYDITKNKTFTKEEAEWLDKYVKDIIKETDAQLKKLEGEYDPFNYKEDILNYKSKLQGNMDYIKEQVKNNEKAETTIAETTKTIEKAVEAYDEAELQILHEQAMKESEELHNKMLEKDKDAKPVDKINETKESLGDDPNQLMIDIVFDWIDEAYKKLDKDFKTNAVVESYIEGAYDEFLSITDFYFSESGVKQVEIIKEAFNDLKNKTIEKYPNNDMDKINTIVDNVEKTSIKKQSLNYDDIYEVKPVPKEIDYSKDPYKNKIDAIDKLVELFKEEAKKTNVNDIDWIFLHQQGQYIEVLFKKEDMTANGARKCKQMQDTLNELLEKTKHMDYKTIYEDLYEWINTEIKFPVDNIIENVNENFKDNVRVEIQNDIKSINKSIEKISENKPIKKEDAKEIRKIIEDRISDTSSYDKLNDAEINYLSEASNKAKKAIEENLRNNNYDKETIKDLLNQKNRIPDERIIRKTKELLSGETISFGYSANYAQGKGTISYLKRFDSVKPSKKIIDKFNNKKPFTKEEIKHLSENVGEIRYLMELCDQAVITGGGQYRPVGYTQDATGLYGREPLDPKNRKYDDVISNWSAGSDGRINECKDYIEKYGTAKAKEKYGEEWVTRAKQIEELNKTVIPQAYTSYRGNHNSPHILDNLIGDSRGKTRYEAGMRYKLSMDTCTSITEEGGDGFSGLNYDGTVGRILITMLHPPKTNGIYLDNKSHFESETELIKNRGAEMQLLLFDEETNTYLVWECYD